MTQTKKDIIIALIVCSIGIFYLVTLRDGHNWGGDFSMYIHHAKNIAEGIDYEDTGYIYNPACPYIGPKAYPPVFPVLLSPVYKCFGLNLEAMKIEIILIFLLFLLVFFMAFQREIPFQYLAAIVAIIGFNPYLWDFKDNVLSDIPFLFFTYSSLLLIHRAYESPEKQKHYHLSAISAGIFIYLSIGTRSIGIVLIPCLIIFDIIKSKKLTLFTIIAITISASFIVIQLVLLPGISTYANEFTINLKTIFINSVRYTDSLSFIWENGYSNIFRVVLFLVISGFATIGYMKRIREKFTIFELFPLFYVVLLITWPSYQGIRFLIPIIPLYIFYAFSGIYQCFSPRQKEIKNLSLIALALMILISYTGNYIRIDYGPLREGIGRNETKALFDYIKKNTEEKDIFIFIKPRVLSLFTERRASIYHWPRNENDLWRYFNQIGATYLVRDYYAPNFMKLFVQKNMAKLKLVYSNLDFRLYKIEIQHPNIRIPECPR